MNTGIMVTAPGIIMVARYARNNLSLPGNFSLAKPKAAKLDVKTCPNVTLADMSMLLIYARPNGTAVNASVKLSIFGNDSGRSHLRYPTLWGEINTSFGSISDVRIIQ